MRRRRAPNSSTPRYVAPLECSVALLSNASTQLPQDIAQRYVLLLDPMLGTPPIIFSDFRARTQAQFQPRVDRP
jgi:hypothetical protein